MSINSHDKNGKNMSEKVQIFFIFKFIAFRSFLGRKKIPFLLKFEWKWIQEKEMEFMSGNGEKETPFLVILNYFDENLNFFYFLFSTFGTDNTAYPSGFRPFVNIQPSRLITDVL